jgi:sortase B
LQQENPDIVGWLSIPYSPVNYPVVQTTDNYTYLNKSFSGEKSSTGTAFMDSGNNVNPLDQNTIIYAHNMGSSRQDMFGSLLKYKDREYYDNRPYIQFDTVYQQHGWWRIFAVIDHNIKSGDFNYLKLNFADQENLPRGSRRQRSYPV